MSAPNRNIDRALLVLRVGVAAVFIAHGYAKLFMMGHAGVTGFFTHLGIPFAGVSAWGVALLEFGGGLVLATGLFTRALSTLFVADMLGAIGFAVFPKGFLGGYELEFLLAVSALTLALAGGGAYSLDARFRSRATQPVSGTT
jgi:putative oxidoreductase